MLDATSLRFATLKRYKGYTVATDCELDVERLAFLSSISASQAFSVSVFQECNNASSLQFCW
jgi:hypothetical protein